MTTLLFAEEAPRPAKPARCDCGSSRFDWRDATGEDRAGWECLECGEIYEVEIETLEMEEGEG
jgi:hypothetical protein